MSPSAKKFLIPFIAVDLLFFAGLAIWWIHPHLPVGKMVLRVDLRSPESKLTEIDLVNDGNASGPVTATVDVSWPDADLVDAKGLGPYGETSTGRRSERFFPQSSATPATLAPGATCAIGWVKLTDNVPVHAEIAAGPPS